MQKFILLRGHEGAGKSTFAQQKIAEFQAAYPNAKIVYIDNDALLTDKNGVYHTDFKRYLAAHQHNMAQQNQAFLWAKNHPNQALLIINANTNQKAKTCLKMLKQAQENGLMTEVYRLYHRFQNLHFVSEEDVQKSIERLNQNPIEGEIHVLPEKSFRQPENFVKTQSKEKIC